MNMIPKLVVLGGGESGTGTAILAVQKGYAVFLSDKGTLKPEHKEELERHGIDYEEGMHQIHLMLDASEVVKSPGIPDDAEVVQALLDAHIPVISEIEFAWRFTRAKSICVTGSNGKTTTTLLIHHMLEQAGVRAELAGNVGISLARRIAMGSHPDWFVIELSSFQLDHMYHFKADIAVLTNITPDHLDRYHYCFQHYIASKFRITQNQTSNDYVVYCADDPIVASEMERVKPLARLIPFSLTREPDKGAYVADANLFVNWEDELMRMPVQEVSLQGKHNLYNSMAAAITGLVLKIKKESIRSSLMSFKGVEHRLEKVLTIRGVEYMNDSKATNVNSAWYALECMTRPVVWIAGGVDKGNDYSELYELVDQKVKALICLGKDNAKLKEAFGARVAAVVEVLSMEQAVQAAYEMSEKGDVVLLSPCCASFDLFQNYEHRGRLFKECVRNL